MNRNLMYCVIALLGVAIGYVYIQKQPADSGAPGIKNEPDWQKQSQDWPKMPPSEPEVKPEPKITPPPTPPKPEPKQRNKP